MRDFSKYMVASVVGAIIFGAPAVAVEKIHSVGTVVSAAVDETGNVANSGMTQVQNIGQPPAGDPSTTTTAPAAGSGRG